MGKVGEKSKTFSSTGENICLTDAESVVPDVFKKLDLRLAHYFPSGIVAKVLHLPAEF